MKKRLFTIVFLIIFIHAFTSCVTNSEVSKQEYGILIEAVTSSSEKIIGEYGENIPENFSEEHFKQFVKHKIPDKYYKVLIKYPIKVRPKGTYYLLLAFNPENNSLILFHYSCSNKVGAILNEPGKYDINNLDLYDKCKTQSPGS